MSLCEKCGEAVVVRRLRGGGEVALDPVSVPGGNYTILGDTAVAVKPHESVFYYRAHRLSCRAENAERRQEQCTVGQQRDETKRSAGQAFARGPKKRSAEQLEQMLKAVDARNDALLAKLRQRDARIRELERNLAKAQERSQ